MVKAQCPAAGMVLIAEDTTTVYTTGAGNTNTINSPYTCNSTPFFVYTQNSGCGTSACIYAPCLRTDYYVYYTNWRNNVTETIDEPAGNPIGCLAPSNSCAGYFGKIGGTTPPVSGVQGWLFSLYDLDPTQSHSFTFCKTGGTTPSTTTVSIEDCWNGTTLAGPYIGTAVPCATLTPAAGSMGSALYTITPTVSANGFQDLNIGFAYVDPKYCAPGTYTVTYTFTAPGGCAPVSANYTFTVAPPNISPNWNNIGPLCDNGSCVSLSSQVTGQAGGTWSGTGVSGTNFCPATSGAGNFPVTYSVGVSATCGNTQTHTVTVNQTPTVTANAVPTTICAGQSSVLTGGGATNYTWSANAGGGTAQTATVSPAGNTTYTVTGVTSGCSNTGTVSVAVNPLPTVTSSANPTTICAGQSSILTAGGATSYTWDANAGNATTTSVTVTPASSLTYTVSGTDNNGCINSSTVAVTVNPVPSLTVTASSNTICSGATTTLSVSGATTYSWQPGGSTAQTLTVSPGVSTTYTAYGTSSSCVDSQMVSITVNPTPTVAAVASPTATCAGQTVVLTASGSASYTWSANAGSATTATVAVTPTITTVYSVTSTQGSCSDSTTVTVTIGPAPTVTVSASQSTICSGITTTLSATGATSYSWAPGGTSGSTYTVSPNTNTTYTVYGNTNGCVDSQMVSITVNPTPIITAMSSPTVICSGQNDTLTASGATSYTWMPGSISGQTVTVTPNATTVYTVTGDNGSCQSTQTVTVNVTPTPTVIAIAPSPTVCSGQQIPIIAGGATTYTWSANAGSATTQTVVVSPVNNPTTYTVTGANGNCLGTATVSISIVTQPTLSISSTSTAVCSGMTDTLMAVFSPTVSAINWLPGGMGTNTVVVTPGSTTIYTATATNGGCSDMRTIQVTVNPTPTLSPVASQTVCAGQPVAGITFAASAGATVGWTNNNTGVGIAANGTGNILGYPAPNVSSTQTATITAVPADMTTSCIGNPETFTVVINPSPTVNTGATDSALCGTATGGVHGISASGGTAPLTYQWTTSGVNVPNATSPNLTGVLMGTYSLQVTDSKGCKAGSGPYTVGGTPAVVAAFTASQYTGTAPLTIHYTDQSTGAANYNWTFGNNSTSTAQNPSTTYSSGGTYVVILTASNGTCSDTAMRIIIVEQPISLVVPNIFSPNGDGINEEFGIISSGITQLNCEIFNRWGQKVKTLTSPTDVWDGKLNNGNSASDGTYYYVLTASSYDGKNHEAKGTITLVR
jgi:gliding motility-associated-like protein